MSVRSTLIAAMLMLFVPMSMDLTLARVMLDFQGMVKVALVSLRVFVVYKKTAIVLCSFSLSANKNLDSSSAE